MIARLMLLGDLICSYCMLTELRPSGPAPPTAAPRRKNTWGPGCVWLPSVPAAD